MSSPPTFGVSPAAAVPPGAAGDAAGPGCWVQAASTTANTRRYAMRARITATTPLKAECTAWREDGTAGRYALRQRYPRSAPLDHLVIDPHELRRHVRPVEFGRAARAGLAQSYAQGRLADEPLHCGSEAVRISRLDE